MMPATTLCNHPRDAWRLCDEVLGDLLLDFNSEIYGVFDCTNEELIAQNLQNAAKILAQLIGHIYSIVHRLKVLGFPEYANDMQIILDMLVTENLQNMAVQDHIHALASRLATQEH